LFDGLSSKYDGANVLTHSFMLTAISPVRKIIGTSAFCCLMIAAASLPPIWRVIQGQDASAAFRVRFCYTHSFSRRSS
jgi:hypothetical protein